MPKPTKQNIQYRPDILGKSYECTDINCADDNDGKVIATLVRKLTNKPCKKAVLYIHGFIDYFFQKEMAEKFNEQGFNFYALDLRKYGRSHLSHQQFYDVKNLSEYNEEITKALDIIASESNQNVLLAGHSTGGLITTLYAAKHPYHPLIKALWVNSPFYDFNKSNLEKNIGIPILAKMGKAFPNIKFPSGLNSLYVPSLHISMYGEWNFNLEWKKENYPCVYLGFVHAIYEAQKQIHDGIYLSIPTLVMYSHQSKHPKQWNIDAQNSDIILNVKDIEKWASRFHGNVQLCEIKNGLHDLVLSTQPVRKNVYTQLFKWLNVKIP